MLSGLSRSFSQTLVSWRSFLLSCSSICSHFNLRHILEHSEAQHNRKRSGNRAKKPNQPSEGEKSADHILEHRENHRCNRLITHALERIQPDFAVIGKEAVCFGRKGLTNNELRGDLLFQGGGYMAVLSSSRILVCSGVGWAFC